MKHQVGLVVHRSKPAALAFAREVIAWLQARQIDVRIEPGSARSLERPDLAHEADTLLDTDFLITLGGDGTILTAARMASPAGVPILGVHMGRFGFIAETHPEDLFPHLERLLRGEIKIEERLMVSAEVYRNDALIHRNVGLNEALVKSGMSHMLQMRTFLRDAPFATYPADGIIVSTPTGSTGYALSAGGPIVEPTVQALLIVPICPHTLSARPLLVPADEVVEIWILSDDGEVIFAVDGVEEFPLQSGDRVVVRRADYSTRLITVGHATFYRKVHARYLYGERLNE